MNSAKALFSFSENNLGFSRRALPVTAESFPKHPDLSFSAFSTEKEIDPYVFSALK